MNPSIARASAGLLLGCSLSLAQGPGDGQVLAPYKWEGRNRDTVQDRLVLYYFGAWDEVSVGSNWFNELTQHYLAQLRPSAAVRPHFHIPES